MRPGGIRGLGVIEWVLIWFTMYAFGYFSARTGLDMFREEEGPKKETDGWRRADNVICLYKHFVYCFCHLVSSRGAVMCSDVAGIGNVLCVRMIQSTKHTLS